MQVLERVDELAKAGEPGKAWALLKPVLTEAPNDPRLLLMATYVLDVQGEYAVAYQIAKRVAEMLPKDAAAWLNVGKLADTMWMMDEAIAAYEKALAYTREERLKLMLYVNIGAVHLQMGRFRKAREYGEKAIKLDPENLKSRHNIGLSQLAAREWVEGWKNYRASMGSSARIQYQYGPDCGEWQGEPDRVVVVTGEQGLGDEINAASMYPDLIGVSKRVIIDCDARLKNLFQRSFPTAKVYGTRSQKVLNWDEADHHPDCSITGMQLGEYFRPSDESFPGTQYLTPCPTRTAGWRAALAGRKNIGIAWSGGVQQTGAKFRRWTLDDMLPIFRSLPGARFVCLQYKDAQAEIDAFRKKHPDIEIVQYPWATLTPDYDDTAALVAACDCVVSMQTSVIHLAGALGVPAFVGVSYVSQWRYGESGDSMPWYKSVKLFRQERNGNWPMVRIGGAAREHLGY